MRLNPYPPVEVPRESALLVAEAVHGMYPHLPFEAVAERVVQVLLDLKGRGIYFGRQHNFCVEKTANGGVLTCEDGQDRVHAKVVFSVKEGQLAVRSLRFPEIERKDPDVRKVLRQLMRTRRLARELFGH